MTRGGPRWHRTVNLPASETVDLTDGVAVGCLGLDGSAGLVEALVLGGLPSA